jgi:hypothetical protein
VGENEQIKNKTCLGAKINGVRVCGLDKPITEFYYHPRSKDRLSYYCKGCLNARQREYYRTRPGRRIRRMAYVRRRIKELETKIPEMKRYREDLIIELSQLETERSDGTEAVVE